MLRREVHNEVLQLLDLQRDGGLETDEVARVVRQAARVARLHELVKVVQVGDEDALLRLEVILLARLHLRHLAAANGVDRLDAPQQTRQLGVHRLQLVHVV